jgi:adenylylsulfate kinase-like enzyme
LPAELARRRGPTPGARRGEFKQFTGIDDPWEAPLNAALRLTTIDCVPKDKARRIVEHLVKQGFLAEDTLARG